MVAVFGDVHGCFYTLETLYGQIKEKYPDIEVYGVGDLVDRGNFSRQTVDFIIEKKIKIVVGNHDLMFYYAIKEPGNLFARAWQYNGNEPTLRSYGEEEEVMEEHLKFIKSSPLFFNLEDCFISHAGISQKYRNILPPNPKDSLDTISSLITMDHRNEEGILWNRSKLLNLNKLQIVGHTKQKEVREDREANALYIDTGACAGNKLSAVIIENSSVVEIISEKTDSKDIESGFF